VCSTIRLRLPVSLTSFEKVTYLSNGWDDLPCTVAPISASQEKDILDFLMGDLNDDFCFDLCTNVTVSREGSQPRQSSRMRKIVIIGASFASRLADALEELGEATTLIKMPSWMPNTLTISTAMEELEKLTLDNPDDLIIFYNLDCAAFYARDSQGSLIPSRRYEEHFLSFQFLFKKILYVQVHYIQ
jgi:hypothetical protein